MTEHKSYKFYLKQDSPFLGEWDLPSNEDLVLTIKDVREGEITGEKGRIDRGMVLYFEENYKPLFCNITNARVIEVVYKTSFVDEWIGKKIQLFVDPNIHFGTKIVKGIRIRPYEPKTAKVEYHCSVCGKEIPANTFKASVAKYGKAYCSKECVEKDTKGEDLL